MWITHLEYITVIHASRVTWTCVGRTTHIKTCINILYTPAKRLQKCYNLKLSICVFLDDSWDILNIIVSNHCKTIHCITIYVYLYCTYTYLLDTKPTNLRMQNYNSSFMAYLYDHTSCGHKTMSTSIKIVYKFRMSASKQRFSLHKSFTKILETS